MEDSASALMRMKKTGVLVLYVARSHDSRCECVTFSPVDSYNGTCRLAAERTLIETRIALSHPWRNSLSLARWLETWLRWITPRAQPNPTFVSLCVYIFTSRNNFQGQNTQVMFRAHSYLPASSTA